MRRSPQLGAGQEADAANRRKHPRARTFANGILTTASVTAQCRVLDISAEGANIRLDGGNGGTADAIRVHEPATLTVKGMGFFRGVIAWRRKGAVGMHITEGNPVAPAAAAAGGTPETSARTGREATPITAVNAGMRFDAPPAPLVAAVQPRSVFASPRGSVARAERDRIEAAVAILHPVIFDRIRPEVAVCMPEARLAAEISALVAEAALEAKLSLNASDQAQVQRRVLDEMVGFGPLEPLFADESVSDILVNGPRQVYVERGGRLEATDITFLDDQHVLNVAARMVSKAGRRIDESSPLADARLADGSRLNVIIPPLALRGPMLSIRKFSKKDITLDNMTQSGCMSPAMASMLKVAARCRLNILISGGTGAGKTTLLNALAQMIDPSERIITIEDAAELQLPLPHVGSLETRPPNLEGENEISMRDLLRNALRMRPDRIILGEVRGAEAFDMLQAMNTGHDGSLGTIHASGPREAMTRLENMVLMSGYDLPARFIRTQIASAVQLIVQIARMRDGKRRVTSITEIVGTEGDVITSQELFTFRTEGDGPRGEVLGRFAETGLRPRFMAKAELFGLGQALKHAVSVSDGARAGSS